jgi:hypothetical protein
MPVGLAVTMIAAALAAAAAAAVIAAALIAGSSPAASPSPTSGSSTADMLAEGSVLAIEAPWETFQITSASGVSPASGSRHAKRDFAYEMVASPTDLPRFVQQTRMQS